MRLPGVGVVKAGSWIHGIHDTFCSCKCLKLSMIKDLLNYFGELKIMWILYTLSRLPPKRF